MKKLIPFIIITFSVFILNSCFKANDNVGHDGRCTGYAPCSACTDCSRCGHCGASGSCGACTGKSSRSSSKKRKSEKHKTSKAKSNKPPKVRIDKIDININSNNRYFAGFAGVKIYEKPSDKLTTVVTVTKNARLIKLQEMKDWYRVKVESSGKTGYVKRKDVK